RHGRHLESKHPTGGTTRSHRAHSLARYLSALLVALVAVFGLASCASVKSGTTPPSSMPSISSFQANPATVNSGSTSTLSWATTGVISISISPGSFTPPSASGSTVVSPTSTTTYTLTATNSAGSVTMTTKVTVTPAPSKPTINSFAASPSIINSGSSS